MEPLTGSCLCKGVTYSIKGEPQRSVICHCLNCQKSSGSAFRSNLFFKKSEFEITSGADLIREYKDEAIDRAPNYIMRNFCSVCGSNLFSINASRPEGIVVTSGCLDEPSKARTPPPQNQFFCKRRRDWMGVNGIETVDTQGMS